MIIPDYDSICLLYNKHSIIELNNCDSMYFYKYLHIIVINSGWECEGRGKKDIY